MRRYGKVCMLSVSGVRLSLLFLPFPCFFLIIVLNTLIIQILAPSKSAWASCCDHVLLDVDFIEQKIFAFTLISRESRSLSGNLFYFYVLDSSGVLTATHRPPESVCCVVNYSQILPGAIIYYTWNSLGSERHKNVFNRRLLPFAFLWRNCFRKCPSY